MPASTQAGFHPPGRFYKALSPRSQEIARVWAEELEPLPSVCVSYALRTLGRYCYETGGMAAAEQSAPLAGAILELLGKRIEDLPKSAWLDQYMTAFQQRKAEDAIMRVLPRIPRLPSHLN